MTNSRDYGPITDEDLVAYLDGMLDDEPTEHVERELAKDRALEERLALLKAGDRPFAESFDLLLKEAPHRRLEEILDRALNPPQPAPEIPAQTAAVRDARPSTGRTRPWGGWRMLAAAAVRPSRWRGSATASQGRCSTASICRSKSRRCLSRTCPTARLAKPAPRSARG